MRNNYVGDIGDFFKYGLLRSLSDGASDGLKLGVVWYLYEDPCKPTDGLHLDYLERKHRERFRLCNATLYDALKGIIDGKKRHVSEIPRRRILPEGTMFFEDPLSFAEFPKGSEASIRERLQYRNGWIARAMAKTACCTHVFFDPDNGLQIDSVPRHRDKAAKFCYFDDLAPFWNRGQSLIIYQHCNRNGSVQEQIAECKNQLLERCPGAAFVRGIYLFPYGGRVFFVIAQDVHATTLRNGLDDFEQRFAAHIGANRSHSRITT